MNYQDDKNIDGSDEDSDYNTNDDFEKVIPEIFNKFCHT